jgi:hypothetical protein
MNAVVVPGGDDFKVAISLPRFRSAPAGRPPESEFPRGLTKAVGYLPVPSLRRLHANLRRSCWRVGAGIQRKSKWWKQRDYDRDDLHNPAPSFRRAFDIAINVRFGANQGMCMDGRLMAASDVFPTEHRRLASLFCPHSFPA